MRIGGITMAIMPARAERHAERPLEVRLLDAQPHGRDEDEHVGRDEQDDVDHDEVLERPDDEDGVEHGHQQDGRDRRAEAPAHARDRLGEQPVRRDREQRPRAGGQVVEVQGEVAEQRRGEQRDAERRAAERLADLDERDVAVAGLGGEAVPVAVAGEAGERGQHVHDDDERHREHERPRDDLLRVADLARERRHRLVARVHPDADGEAEGEHAAGAEERHAGHRDRRERVEVPLGQADDDEHDERRQDEDREQRRAERDELDADDVHEREDGDDRPADHVEPELAEVEPVLQVADAEHDVHGRVDEDRERPPPGRLEAPEVAEARGAPRRRSRPRRAAPSRARWR